jgi:methylated-DNA-protein-cysteine methyltransferase related protein
MNLPELPPAAQKTFYHAVWMIARQIPAGKVSTYGQIAGFIPCPSGVLPEDFKAFRARWAGNAMAACPADVPWQRVINAQGKISQRPGAETQRLLLEAEGVTFDNRDRIDMKRYAWEGPPADWLRANHLLAPDEPEQLSLL